MERYQRDVGKVYLVVGLCCLLLTGSFYFFGFKPLSDRLRTEHTHEIHHFLETGQWRAQSVLGRYRDLALQSASRTAIRKKQVAYLKGAVSRQELVAFSVPKLADAVAANPKTILGISRFDPRGELLFAVGAPLPEAAVAACELDRLHQVRMVGPVQIGGSRRLLYCSPLIDNDAGHVGADILVIDDNEIQAMVDVPQENLANFGIVRAQQII